MSPEGKVWYLRSGLQPVGHGWVGPPQARGALRQAEEGSSHKIDEAEWSKLYSATSQPFDPPKSGKIAVKVINPFGDGVLRVYLVQQQGKGSNVSAVHFRVRVRRAMARNRRELSG